MNEFRQQSGDSPKWRELHLLRRLTDAAFAAGCRAVREANAASSHARQNPAHAFAEASSAAAVKLLGEHSWAALLHVAGSPPQHIGSGAPQARLFLTPTSEPHDFVRGMPFAAFSHFCVAAAPPIGPLEIATVRAAVIRPLAGADMLMAFDGARAWAEWQGQHHEMSTTMAALPEASISANLDGHAPGRALAEVLGMAREVRCIGGTAAALLAIASGQLHAHVDLRGTLGAHDWLAAAALLRAAGGEVMLLDKALEQAPPPNNPDQRHALVAAASRDLLEEIMAMLRQTWL